MSNPPLTTRPASSPTRRCLGALLFVGALLAAGTPAMGHDHDSSRSGHPLRIVAYLVHPVGVILDTLILKPLHWLGSHEPIPTLIGHEED